MRLSLKNILKVHRSLRAYGHLLGENGPITGYCLTFSCLQVTILALHLTFKRCELILHPGIFIRHDALEGEVWVVGRRTSMEG